MAFDRIIEQLNGGESVVAGTGPNIGPLFDTIGSDMLQGAPSSRKNEPTDNAVQGEPQNSLIKPIPPGNPKDRLDKFLNDYGNASNGINGGTSRKDTSNGSGANNSDTELGVDIPPGSAGPKGTAGGGGNPSVKTQLSDTRNPQIAGGANQNTGYSAFWSGVGLAVAVGGILVVLAYAK
jgi:hypothetical protein